MMTIEEITNDEAELEAKVRAMTTYYAVTLTSYQKRLEPTNPVHVNFQVPIPSVDELPI